MEVYQYKSLHPSTHQSDPDDSGSVAAIPQVEISVLLDIFF